MQTICRCLLLALLAGIPHGTWAGEAPTLPERALIPGDVVQITIVGEKDLSRTATIGADGTVSLGYPGVVRLVGLTRAGAEKAIRRALLRYVRDPVVSVDLAEHRFSVLGAVNRPGQYTMLGDRVPVLDALAQAGGPADRANLRRVMLMRHTATGQQRVRLDLQEALQEKERAGALPMMESGDVLYVNRRKQPIGTTILTVAGVLASLAWVFRR